ncbi:MAG: M48 family metallopeptidase [Chloroflexota bacterium]
MTILALIIVTALVLEFVLETAADILNLRSLRAKLPPALDGIYRTDEYRTSQEYARSRTRLGLMTRTLGLLILFSFWFGHGFNYLDQIVRAWGFNPIVSGLFYFGILGAAYNLLTLPASIYATFVIEERFGFNRTSVSTFIMDRLKGLALLVIIGSPLLAGILWLFEYTAPYAWLWAWFAAVLFTVVLEFISPIWIMPLFNRFTPMGPGELKEAIQNYARSAGYNIGKIFVIDSSRRSAKTNAFFTGFGRSKRIALFDTLVDKHTVPELVAILAHEIGHYKKKHVVTGMIIGIAQAGLMFYLLSSFLGSDGLYRAFYLQSPSIYAGLVCFGFIYMPLEFVLSIALQALSRRNEYEADRFAAQTIVEPAELANALRKLSASNLANLTPHPFYVFLNYSHPPLLERIQAIQRITSKQ